MKYGFIFTLSYLSLLWERLWNRFWPAVTLILLFIALSLFNLLLLFGTAGHLLILGLFTAALAVTLVRAPFPFSFPSRDDVERCLEKTNALRHRPLETLHDRPAEGLAQDSLGLWQKHLQKTLLALNLLKIYAPQPNVASRDRWALRHVAVILLAVALVVAQGDAASRLRRALTPEISLLDKKTIALDLWIVPPEYTHESAVFVASSKQSLASRATIAVPAGSLLKLRLSGLRTPARLNYAGQAHKLTEAEPHNFTFELPLQQSGELQLDTWFSHLGQWSVTVLPDMPPEVSVVQTEPTPRSAIKITYKAHDDHGITKLTGIITNDAAANKTFRFDLPPTNAPDATNAVADLTAHPWAGAPVTLALEAEDNAGHTTVSAPIVLVLPERTFTNPVAQRIIAERKILLQNQNILSERAVAGNLAEIADNPALYKGDIVTFMALSIAVKRLVYDGGSEAVASVTDLLWEVALKLEDGGLSLAQRELRDALQKLSESLGDKNTTKQQMQDILDDVQKKMKQYIQALAQELQQRMQQGKKMPVLSPELAQKFMKNIDINKILEQMKQMSQANSRENLQKMADNLKNAIDNLDMKKFDQMQEKQMQAMEALQNLEDIIHRQQSLYDKTNKSDDPAESKAQQKEQSALRELLGTDLKKLGEATGHIPENFAKADQAMKGSAEALGKGQAKESLPHQKTALEEMQKGLEDMVSQMAQSMQQSIMSFGMMPNSGNFGEGYDPLGRPNGMPDVGTVKIPTEKEQRRVQEIIEELRNRSNEPNRTKVERDYIDRLLDQF
jgi:uncharacterized protein (TIGR02302 family)